MDWNKTKIVFNKDGYWVITSGQHTEELFSGTVLNHTQDDKFPIGMHRSDWVKEEFKPIDVELSLHIK